MIENKFPRFEKGSILTSGLLDSLRDYPKDIIEIIFNSNSDGIIEGFTLSIKNKEQIEIDKGILKFDKNIFIKNDITILDIPSNKGNYYINIVFTNNLEQVNRKFDVKSGEIIISENKASNLELELGRFSYREGAKLNNFTLKDNWSRYEANYLDIINVKYSYKGEFSALSPEILSLFGKKLFKKEDIEYSPLDLSIALQSINQTVKYNLLIEYINFKLKKSESHYSNEELYESLGNILKEFKILKYNLERTQKEGKENIKERDGMMVF